MEQGAVVAQSSSGMTYFVLFVMAVLTSVGLYLYYYFQDFKIFKDRTSTSTSSSTDTNTDISNVSKETEPAPKPIESEPETTTETCQEVIPSTDKLKGLIKKYLEEEKGQENVVIISVYIDTKVSGLTRRGVHAIYQTKSNNQESRSFVLSLNKVNCEWKVVNMSEANKGILKPICLSYNGDPSRHHLFNDLSRCNEAPFTGQGVMSVFNRQIEGTKPYCVTWGKGKPSKSMIYEGTTECGNKVDEYKWYHFYAYPHDKEVSKYLTGDNTYKKYCVSKLENPNRIVVNQSSTCDNELMKFWSI